MFLMNININPTTIVSGETIHTNYSLFKLVHTVIKPPSNEADNIVLLPTFYV